MPLACGLGVWGSMVEGLGFAGLWFRSFSLGLTLESHGGFGVWGSGFRVKGFRFFGFRV